MIALTLAELAEAVDGRLVRAADPATVVDGVSETDSRLVVPGGIFFALRGEETDGHLFAEQAVEKGAALLIVERELDLDVPQIVVADGYTALAALARSVVQRVRDRGDLRVVGITGSNGKTTTKNMLRAILERQGPTVAPPGSFNNHVGAPISMLRITDETRYLVVEMGASKPGAIAHLVSIVTPDVAVVLKVGLAHIGGFGGIEGTQKAKSEMVTDLPETSVAVLNADDPRVVAMEELTRARVTWFGQSARADVSARDVDATAAGTTFTLVAAGEERPVRLRILGEHHVMNALAATTVALELGLSLDDVVPVLEEVARAERWRMEVLDPGTGWIVINDAYNASPDSTAAALKTLAQIAGPGQRTIAVLGEMAELGEHAAEEHDRVGRLAVRLDIRQLVVVGERARGIHLAAGLEGSWDGESVAVGSLDEAYDVVSALLRPGDVVLVKSSKSAGLRFLGDRLGGVAE
ncbi:UDP-N-acetylmuramoyl-tripeptide--D-alanyl-D-alanine ligase [Herbiconiux sp. SYSU D00978]|uniref:UDP-N-acetylmuramoyl-tripeptide--D-alanyl-D- alanine ligase n=1 Tax=Herbiconiux sp. SYSU D00978 TaxID=2812562 RepID=UPI001A959E4B|nr:UDP-N-acetylmuramoyl-tripeptide--D-alanyl-D-alanine ligase [Herbiconiux sp. SYSU D00978]